MAGISRNKNNGSVRITFSVGRKRTAIRIGKVNDAAAAEFATNLQTLLTAFETNTAPKQHIIEWVLGLSEKFQRKLAALGLIEIEFDEPSATRDSGADVITLRRVFDDYINTRTVAKSTVTNWQKVRRRVCDYFGEDAVANAITVDDVLRWREKMLASGGQNGAPLGENTVRKSTQIARHVFKRAMKTWPDYLKLNPFDDDELPVTTNDRKKEYIGPDRVKAAIDIMPDNEHKAVLTLARVAGLRVQSEAPLMEWSHVDWGEQGSIAVHSPKTKNARRVPLFPAVRRILEALYDDATIREASGGEPSQLILPTFAKRSSNWATPLKKRMQAAGQEPWAAFWNSLRASAAIDIARLYGLHLASEWLGHDIQVAVKHYQQATASDYLHANTGNRDKRTMEWSPFTVEKTPKELFDSIDATIQQVENGTMTPPKSGNNSGTERQQSGQKPTTPADHSESQVVTGESDETPYFTDSIAVSANEKGNPEELPEWSLLDSNQ